MTPRHRAGRNVGGWVMARLCWPIAALALVSASCRSGEEASEQPVAPSELGEADFAEITCENVTCNFDSDCAGLAAASGGCATYVCTSNCGSSGGNGEPIADDGSGSSRRCVRASSLGSNTMCPNPPQGTANEYLCNGSGQCVGYHRCDAPTYRGEGENPTVLCSIALNRWGCKYGVCQDAPLAGDPGRQICAAGNHVQGFSCPDSTPGDCTTAACDGSGNCVGNVNMAQGSRCCMNGLGGGQGSCNSSGVCGRSSDLYPSATLPVTLEVTAKAINKYLYKQFSGHQWNTTGYGASISACVPTGGTASQMTTCLNQNVTSGGTGNCAGLAYCAKQTLAFNLRIDIPKVVFETGLVKLQTTVYVRSSSHAQFERNIPIKFTVSMPSGSVSATKLVRVAQGVQASINAALATLGRIPKDLKDQAVARLGPGTDLQLVGQLAGIIPQEYHIVPDEVMLVPPFDAPQKRFYYRDNPANDDVRIVLNDLTLSWAIVSGKLQLTLTPKVNACIY